MTVPKKSRIRLPFKVGDVLAYRLPSGGYAVTQVYAWDGHRLGNPDGSFTTLDDGVLAEGPIFVTFAADAIPLPDDVNASSATTDELPAVVDSLQREITAWSFVIGGPRSAWNDGDWLHLGNYKIYQRLVLPELVGAATYDADRVMLEDPYTGNVRYIDGPVDRCAYRGSGWVTVAWLKSMIQIAYGDLDAETESDIASNPQGYCEAFVLM